MAIRKRPSETGSSTTKDPDALVEAAKVQSTGNTSGKAISTRKAEAPEEPPRFHYFIIDSGWKSHSARVLRENFRMIREFENHDPMYVLSREQSIEIIRANPDLIGKDPILLVHDLQAKGGRGASGYHGFRLCLGVIKNAEQALFAMQEFLRFIADHRNSRNIEKDMQRKLHREGMEGAIEVIRESAQEMMA